MAFEDCYAVTLKVCRDCVGHIGGDGGGCCHTPHYGDERPYYVLERLTVDPLAERPCPTGLRLERRHRDVVTFTSGCTDDDCEACRDSEGGPDLGFYASDCEGCGVGHGDREHYTAWVRNDPRPVRTLTRNGWNIGIHPMTGTGTIYAVAERDRGMRYRYLISEMPRNGAERWQRMATFVASLPAA